jgi:hypothetical protein
MILPTRASQHQNARTPRRNGIADSAVGTADFADNTDREGIAVQWVFTRRAVAKEVSDHDEAHSHPCHPWFLNCRIQGDAHITFSLPFCVNGED